MSFQANSQKFSLGKVSLKELQEKKCPTDTNAVAAILFSKAKTIYIYEKEGFFLNHIYEFRVKIYDKKGLDWANIKVPYYVGYKNIRSDIVTFSDCVTYNVVNNEIVKTKIKSEGIFDTKTNEYWNEASATMPNVQAGSIIEYRYTIKSYNFTKFPVFHFQYSIPTNFAEYVTEIPEFYIYNPITTGFAKVNSKSEIGFGYQNYDDEHNQGLHMSYKQINTVHTSENVVALKSEDFVDNIENYRGSIDYELEKTRFPEVPEKIYTQTWEDVAKSIYKEKEFGEELNKKSYFLNDLKVILSRNDSTEIGKLNTVFKFVQNKMNWNNFYGYSTEKGVESAFADGIGNVAEINFILISMLNRAGFNAKPVLCSTIGHGIPLYPNRTVFNYVIAAVDIDGVKILLDASHKYTTLNVLPTSLLNWIGRLISSDATSEEINLFPTTMSKNQSNLMVSIDANGNISGKFRTQKSDYEALKFRENEAQESKENYLDQLESKWSGVQIKDYVIENKATDLNKPIVETFSFTMENKDNANSERLYINPLLFFTQTKNAFNQEERVLPIYFGYKKQTKCNVSYEIPEGYAIEFIPKSILLTISDNVGIFSYKVLAQENKIQVAATIEMDSAILSAATYQDLKEFYRKIIEKENEKIILKKL